MSEWTNDTLKELLDERFVSQTRAVDAAFASQTKAVEAALASAKEAVIKAEGASNKRFEENNGYREQLAAQATTFITRKEIELLFTALNEKVAELTSRMDLLQGRTVGSSGTEATKRADLSIKLVVAGLSVSALVGIASIIAVIVSLVR